MKVVNVKIVELKPYVKNAKKHPENQIELLKKNIEKFGFTTPILIDEKNNVIAGHGRLIVMQGLNKEEIPCVRMENLSNEEVKALRLADNRIAEMGDWDMDLVIEELKELSSENLDLTGFDLSQLALDPDPLKNNHNQSLDDVFRVYIDCESEDESKNIFDILQGMNLNPKILNL